LPPIGPGRDSESKIPKLKNILSSNETEKNKIGLNIKDAKDALGYRR
jgi:hypothetical protein